jgi:hypothetical protein
MMITSHRDLSLLLRSEKRSTRCNFSPSEYTKVATPLSNSAKNTLYIRWCRLRSDLTPETNSISTCGEKFRRMKNRPLVMKILREVEPRPSGLVLPDGKVVKRFDPTRIECVIWKIVRGLFFHHHGKTLPQKLNLTWTFTGPDDGPPPEHFQFFDSNHPSHGKYPGVFVYQFDS